MNKICDGKIDLQEPKTCNILFSIKIYQYTQSCIQLVFQGIIIKNVGLQLGFLEFYFFELIHLRHEVRAKIFLKETQIFVNFRNKFFQELIFVQI